MRSSQPLSPNRLGVPGSVRFALAIALAAGLAACGGSASPSPSAAPSGHAGVQVSDAWVRVPMGPDRPAAGYLVITNHGAESDALVSAKSPASMMVEIHETTTDASGMSGMHPIDRLDIGPGQTVTLEPGGYHLMLMQPSDAIAAGKTIELTLVFEKFGEVTLTVEVRAG
jgi:hypothetical protein